MNIGMDGSAANGQNVPFPSLDELRDAHYELLETADADAEPSSAETAARERRIADFISRAAATGALLDAPADRKTAQSFIDYWVASFYTSARYEPDPGTSSPEPTRYSSLTRLAPFNTDLVRGVEQQGERILAELSSKDLELARRILMHLVRLSARTGVCVGRPQRRQTLLALGRVEAGRAILDRLIEARVLKQTPSEEGDLIELRHDSLIRKWDRLARWMDERVKFREAALFWERGGRKRGALLGLDVAKQTKAYGDLNELELEFLSESKSSSRIFIAAAVSAVVLLAAAPLLYVPAYEEWWVPLRADSVREQVRSEESSAHTKSNGIRWLARYNQSLDFSGVSLNGVDLSSAELPNPDLTKARLDGVNFDNARIESGRFDEAIIARTTFVSAALYGGSFDRVLFCRGVDFSNTDLRATSFRNVEFDENNAPIVKNTKWLDSPGWSWTQRKILAKQDQSGRRNSKEFRDLIDAAERGVQASLADSLDRGLALNGKAWLLAVYGAAANAEGVAREAIEILTKVDKLPQDEGAIRDTLGYILLQKGDHMEAVEHLAIAARLDPIPEHRFRYAIALFASGRPNDGIVELREAIHKTDFVPSHDLIWLRAYISGELEMELDRLMVERQPTPPEQSQGSAQPRKCPPSANDQ